MPTASGYHEIRLRLCVLWLPLQLNPGPREATQAPPVLSDGYATAQRYLYCQF